MFQNVKSEIKTLLIVAAIAAILVVGGILLLRELSPVPTPSPQPQAADMSDFTPSEVEGWQTYYNEEFGFALRYPKESILISEGEGTKIDVTDIGLLFIRTPSIQSDECKVYNSYLSGEFGKLVFVNNVEFLKYNIAELENSNTVVESGNFITLQDDYCVDIAFMTTYPSPTEYEQNKKTRGEIFDQILSTFRFVE